MSWFFKLSQDISSLLRSRFSRKDVRLVRSLREMERKKSPSLTSMLNNSFKIGNLEVE